MVDYVVDFGKGYGVFWFNYWFDWFFLFNWVVDGLVKKIDLVVFVGYFIMF